jgi:DNA topoisomerase-1
MVNKEDCGKAILVLVESSSKAKTIERYLNAARRDGDRYVVRACMGHVCDLARGPKGVDLLSAERFGLTDEESLAPKYELTADPSLLRSLRELAKKSKCVYLAADPDREGEAIAWHLKNVLRLESLRIPHFRMVFNEITSDAVERALSSAGEIDMRMVTSQQTRRVMDRVIGFGMTGVLWRNFESRSTLSAGRVQSVVLGAVVEREREVDAHVSERYWTVQGDFEGGVVGAALRHSDRVARYDDDKAMLKLLQGFGREYRIDGSNSRIRKRSESAPAAFSTATLQQAGGGLGLSVHQTMRCAQELYEAGRITYMRTDSTRIGEAAGAELDGLVRKRCGDAYLAGASSGRATRSKQAHAQDAHEAIRPTRASDVEGKGLSGDTARVYALIHSRAVESRMASARFDEMEVSVSNDAMPSGTSFVGKARRLTFAGFRAWRGERAEGADLERELRALVERGSVRLTEMRAGCVWTTPPSRYGEVSMVQFMEKSGVGRPSTYASVVKKLYERDYVVKQGETEGERKTYDDYTLSGGKWSRRSTERAISREAGRLVPTSIGTSVSAFLTKHFGPFFASSKEKGLRGWISYTTRMEGILDDVASGRKSYVDAMRFYGPFMTHCRSLARTRREGRSSAKVALEGQKARAVSDRWVVRQGPYGPLMEDVRGSDARGDAPRFVGLRPYMRVMGMSDMSDFGAEDAALLESIPLQVGSGVVVKYGRYGFYATSAQWDGSRRLRKAQVLHLKARRWSEFVGSLDQTSGAKARSASKDEGGVARGAASKVGQKTRSRK